MLATLGEEKVCEIFSSFSSPLNNDVEYFLKKKSITQLSKTYDLVDEHQCRRKEKWYKNITL